MKLRLAGLVALAIAVAPAALAQATYTAPRTPDGKPDFNGFWTNVSLTSLERSGQFKSLVIPEADAQRIEAGRAAADVRASLPTDPNSGAPKAARSAQPTHGHW